MQLLGKLTNGSDNIRYVALVEARHMGKVTWVKEPFEPEKEFVFTPFENETSVVVQYIKGLENGGFLRDLGDGSYLVMANVKFR
jgi:hypothetical protein